MTAAIPFRTALPRDGCGESRRSWVCTGMPFAGTFAVGLCGRDRCISVGDFVPKVVYDAGATIKSERIIHFVDWRPAGLTGGTCLHLPMVASGGDRARVLCACSVISNCTATAEVSPPSTPSLT